MLLERGPYNSYSIATKLRVLQSEDPYLYINEGVPRSTASYWIQNPDKIHDQSSHQDPFESKKINSLEIELKKQQAISDLLIIVRKIHPHTFTKRKLKSKKDKKTIIEKIKKVEKLINLKTALSAIELSPSTYYRWLSLFQRCEFSKKNCQRRYPHQLTQDEIQIMKNYVTSKKYSHISISSLCLLAQREEKLFCCVDTWYKYTNIYDWKRGKGVSYKKNYRDGLRAKTPNQYWHIDVSKIAFFGPKKYYFQAIIDNFSRYILAWHLTEKISAENTIELIKKAKESHRKLTSTNIVSDGGSENTASDVGEYILESNLNQIIAGKDIKYSNSMIESFFRSLKSNYLNFQKIRGKKDIQRKLKYYINQHNTVIPKVVLFGATPIEAYQEKWNKNNIANLKQKRANALKQRKSLPIGPTCGVCS